MKRLCTIILAVISACPAATQAGQTRDTSIDSAPRAYQVDNRRFLLSYTRQQKIGRPAHGVCVHYHEVERPADGDKGTMHRSGDGWIRIGTPGQACGRTVDDALNAFSEKIIRRM